MIAESLDALHGVKVLRMTHLKGTNRMVLTLRLLDKTQLVISVGIVELLGGMLPDSKLERAKQIRRSGVSAAKRVTARNPAYQYADRERWDAEFLMDHGLPLYWSREWLLSQLEQWGTLVEVARVNGEKERTITAWRAKHQIPMIKGKKTQVREALLREYEASVARGARLSVSKLAERFDVSIGTAQAWLVKHRGMLRVPVGSAASTQPPSD